MLDNAQEITQKMLKPMMEIAASNTAFAVKLINRGAEATVKQLEGNLAHFEALSNAKDINGAMELQKDYLKTATQDFQSEVSAGAKLVQETTVEINKLFQESWSNAQAEIKAAAANVKA